jgi:lipopolysaccharide export system permease protein
LNIFDRHLLREWLQILGLVLAATCGLLLVQVLYDDFRDLRELGARGAVLWKYIGVTMPGFLAIALPFALLISLLYTLGNLHRSNELTAMRAAGIGFMRMTAPIWVMGVLCCGLTWWLNTTIVPWSLQQSRSMRESLQFRQESTRAIPSDRIGASYSVAFDNQLARRMWFFNRFSRFTQRGYGVSVSELDPQRRELRRIVAAEAWYDVRQPGWVFSDGRELTFSPETGELLGSKPFEQWIAPHYREKPELMLLIDRKATDLSLFQLRMLIDHLEVEHSTKATAYAVRYFSLIADTLGPLIVIAIAIPFAVTGVRVNPAVGVSKSIGLFFLYYLLTNFAASLATKQSVEPIIAAWLPNLGMTAVAIWFFVRLR